MSPPREDGAPSPPADDGFVVVAGRHKKARAPAPPRTIAPVQKAPAVLVKVAPGSLYADTVRRMRATGASDVPTVTGLRHTREGQVLVQIRRSLEGVGLTDRFRTTLRGKLGDSVGPIAILRCSTEVEIVDLAPVATEAEVLEALYGACRVLPGRSDDADIQVRGLWSRANGQ